MKFKKNIRKIVGLSSFISMSSFATNLPVSTTPLDLDTSFNSSGLVQFNYGDSTAVDARSYFYDVESTTDGKVIAVGHVSRASVNGAYDMLIVKYNQDGTLDTSFDSDGKLIMPMLDDARLGSVAIQPDGKIIVLAITREVDKPFQVQVMRFNINGALDTSFGDSGKYTLVNPDKELRGKDLAIASNGDILFMAHEFLEKSFGIQKYQTKIIKLDSSGAVAPGFNLAYVDSVHVGDSSEHSIEMEQLSLDDSDNIYVSGRMIGVSNSSHTRRYTMLAGKYNINGDPLTFGNLGADSNFWYLHSDLTDTAPSGVPQSNNILNTSLVLPNGDVVSAGCDATGLSRLQKQTSSGDFVTAFGNNGVQTFDNLTSAGGGEECINELAYHQNIGLIAVGNDSNEQMVFTIDSLTGSLTQLSSGKLIPSSTGTSPNGRLDAISVLKNGKILVSGTTGVPFSSGNTVESALMVHIGESLPDATNNIDVMNFASVNDAPLSSQVTSVADTATISPSGTVTASVLNGAVIRNGGDRRLTGLLGISDGDSLQLSHTSANEVSGSKTTSLIVRAGQVGHHRNNRSWNTGNEVFNFTSIASAADTVPDSFVLQPTSTTLYQLAVIAISNTITVSGINADTPISVTDGEYSINGEGYISTDGIVQQGDTVSVRHTTATCTSCTQTTTLDIGGVIANFESTTIETDTTPDPIPLNHNYSETPLPNETITFNDVITVTGINAPTEVSISASALYSINGGTFTSDTGTVNNNDVISVRYDASAIYNGAKSVEMLIGGISTHFHSTTAEKDTTPANFSFGVVNNVAISTLVTSTPLTVSEINAPTAISIVNGEYSINDGAFMTSASTVSDEDKVIVRHTSSDKNDVTSITELTIGGVVGTFSTKTEPLDDKVNHNSSGGALGVGLLSLLLISGFRRIREL
ncbi:delta-60 repeat domain-containing protein [Shewanella nanhaiensis]|uniref:Uncharacterized protein n=1 Tax=Shewanella nanhaiensis TaxID=2864872 RepID=A0ABS7E342_9GAMM|nr:delta-60 repeat domain-containing protein [Shewanella nanhaiensis]MBW8184067.1 hypothetical protein [Shewanella nanhaiensis]